MPSEVLANRVRRHSGGQLVLEVDGRMVGVCYSQRIGHKKDVEGVSASDIDRLHEADGSVVQLLALNVLPEMQQGGYGDELLEFALEHASLARGVRSVIAVTRCRDYRKHAPMDMDTYIGWRDDLGHVRDSGLRIHAAHGGIIRGAISGYRPGDVENDGFGVFVTYDLATRVQERERWMRAGSDTPRSREHGTTGNAARFVGDCVASILGTDEAAIPLDQPLFDLGIRSPELLELCARIVSHYGVVMPPA